MRFARLDLTRYGKFTDHTLRFPKGPLDLHLIYGPNEAGKSTLRQAILDLLYGFDPRTPFGFKHGMPQLVLGAVLEDGAGAPFEFQRFKRTKQPLLDAQGRSFTEAELRVRLGDSDRAFYTRSFSLNHQSLVEGGRQLVGDPDDVGQMLFQAAAGLSDLHKVRTALQEEADALWGERRRGDAAYYAALVRYEEAETQLRQVAVSANKWNAARRARDAAEAARKSAYDACRVANAERSRLERVKRVATALQELHEARTRRQQLGSPAPLSADAMATLTAAERDLAIAADKLRRCQEKLARDEAALVAIERNPELLAQKHAVIGLANRITEFDKATTDLPVVHNEIAQKAAAVARAAKDLGWRETSVEAIAGKLPSRLQREELSALLRTRGEIFANAEHARNAHADSAAKVADLASQIPVTLAATSSPALSSALARSRALDIANAEPKAIQKVAAAQRTADNRFGALVPWVGEAAKLRLLIVPSMVEVQQHSSARDQLQIRRDTIEATLRAKEVEVARANVAAEAALRDGDLVSAEQLRSQRHRRDALWTNLRSGATTLSTDGERYEAEVAAADDLADRRYARAQAVEQAQLKADAAQALAAEVHALEAQRTAADAALERLADEWNGRMTAMGLSGLSTDGFLEWARKREKALQAAEALEEAVAEREDMVRRAAELHTELLACLVEVGEDVPVTFPLAGLIDCAAAFEKREAEHRGGVNAQRVAYEEALNKLPSLEKKAAAAQRAKDKWLASWADRVVVAGLPTDIGVDAASTALALFEAIGKDCEDIAKLKEARIAPMQAAVDQFQSDTASLVSTCIPDLGVLPPMEAAARLQLAVSEAQHAETEYQRLHQEIVATRKDEAQANDDAAHATAAIAPLLAIADAASVADLRVAIERADTSRELDAAVRRAEEKMLTGGDGLTLTQLETEVIAEDLTALSARIEEVRLVCEQAETHRDRCIADLTLASNAFDQIAGQADAAQAEARRQDALLAMTEAIDEYVRTTTAVRLLKWAMDRYRDEKQGPMLAKASQLFCELTGGSFDKLSLDPDTVPVSLTGHRPNGTFVHITPGFSNGTEDQLYLALRLAALELYLEDARPLPFIADDTFVHWSDDRAGPGFAALARLAEKTQVFVLTHHRHLLEVAREATGGRVQVHEL